MPSLTVPLRFRRPLARIGSLETGSFDLLIRSLKEAIEAPNAASLVTSFPEMPALESSDLGELLSAIASMQDIQRSAHVPASVFADDVYEALQEDAPDLIEGLDRPVFINRMAEILEKTRIYLSDVHLGELRREVERRFCGARILTDCRAAFGEDPSKKPALTVMQTLELKFHDDLGRHREFYVNVDEDDLEVLKSAVERALDRRRNLQQHLSKSDFNVFV